MEYENRLPNDMSRADLTIEHDMMTSGLTTISIRYIGSSYTILVIRKHFQNYAHLQLLFIGKKYFSTGRICHIVIIVTEEN